MILTVGSLNVDLVYHVQRLPAPGETVAATGRTRGLGGKGANQSVAAARAGAEVQHYCTAGHDARDLVAELEAAGVRFTGPVAEMPNGHAVVMVDAAGENAILIHPGTNAASDPAGVEDAVGALAPGDWLVLQNELDLTAYAARTARARHGDAVRVVYSAAPFDAQAVAEVLPHLTHLLMNAGENAALEAAGLDLPPGLVRIVTRGAEGATWHGPEGRIHAPAFAVRSVVDTTGAGDCFAGNLVAALDRGLAPGAALSFAQGAAAIQITRPGAAPAMPTRAETEAFLAARP